MLGGFEGPWFAQKGQRALWSREAGAASKQSVGGGGSLAGGPGEHVSETHPCPQSTNFREPLQPLMQKQVEEMQLKYYNSDVHRAAFVLPEFARKVSPTPRGAGRTQGSLKGHLAHPPSPAPS